MNIQNRRKLWLTSAVAVVLSIASTSALASAMSNEGDDPELDLKTAACHLIGCPNGSRVCGTASGTIRLGAAPLQGEVNVTYTCYEPTPAF